MDIHKNARLTPLGRERLVKMVLGGKRRRPPVKPQAFALAPAANGAIASSRKAWPACRIAAGGRIGYASRRRPR
jgi:hypothetical protein